MDRIGEYEIETELAIGGMGALYAAKRPDGSRVALKVLLPSRRDPAARARFTREAERARRLRHPNVVRVLDAGPTEDGGLYIAMELLEGEDLDVVVANRGPLPAAQVVRIGCAAAAGLSAVHAAGLVHRDVKPANLFLCGDGAVKVLDFGLALAMRPGLELRLTGAKRTVGTPAFMAVEQAEGTRDEDKRTDVWGLGATLYHAVAGRPPFDAPNAPGMLVRIVSEDPDPLPADVPQWLATVLFRALRKERRERWPDMESFGRALANGLALATTAHAPAATPPAPDRTGDTTRAGRPPSRPEAAPARQEPALEDEVRIVSVLWAEDVHDEVVLAASVRAEHGVPFALGSDCTIGVFGGAAWQGDEAERAVRTGLALRARDAAGKLGVATGRGVRSVGGRFTGAVVVAAEQAAATVGIGADPETLRRIRGGYDVADGRVLRRRRGGAIAGVRGPRGGDVALFGREQEPRNLEATLDEAVERRSARGVLLLGPAGIGKSRLRHALLRHVVETDAAVVWLEAHGDAERMLKGWHVFETMLRQLLELPEGSPAEAVRDALQSFCPSPESARFVGEILSAGLSGTNASSVRDDPVAMHDRIVIAIGDLIDSLCRTHRGVVLCVDDAQWADRPSLELLDTLLQRLSGRPLFVLVCGRVEPASCLADLRRIELEGLPASVTRALAEAVSGEHDWDESWIRAIHERSGGNPYFIEELARAVRDGRAELPTSVEAAVQARLDALPRSSKDLLRRASVLGRRFWTECLVALGEPEPVSILSALSRADLVAPGQRSRLAGTTEWTFRTSLVQTIAYQSLTAQQRTSLHRSAAGWLASRPDGEAAEIARHLDRADDPAAATPYWVRATDRALQSGDTRLAIEASGRALERPLDPETTYRLHASRAELFSMIGQWRDEDDEIAALVASASTPAERAVAAVARSRRLRNLSRFPDALATIQEALALGEERAPLLIEAALVRALAGAPEQGLPLVAEAIQEAIRVDDRLTLARALATAAHCHATLGDFGAARPMLLDALDAFRDQGHPARAVTIELNLGYNDLMLGLHDEAIWRLESALDRARTTGNRSAQGWALHNLGLALARAGRCDEGLDAEAAALVLAHASREPRLVQSSLKYTAAILLEAGRPAEALDRVSQAMDGSDALPDTTAAELGTLRAAALVRLGRKDEARQWAERAIALRDRVGGLDAFESELFLAAEDAGIEGSIARGIALLTRKAERIKSDKLRKSFLEQVPANARLLARARR